MRGIFEFIVGSSLFIEKIGAKAQRADAGYNPVDILGRKSLRGMGGSGMGWAVIRRGRRYGSWRLVWTDC